MKKSLFGLAVGTALAFSAIPAFADGYSYDSIKDVAPAAPQPNWSGLYIGAAIGYGIAATDIQGGSFTLISNWDFNGTEIAAKGLSSDGVQGTLALGYDRQIHSGLLIGFFGDYTFGDLDNETLAGGVSYDDGAPLELWPEPGHLRTKIDNSWSLGGRIGLVRENTLWYAFAGYAQANLDWDFTAYFDFEPVGGGSGSKKLKGYFLGLGVEHQLFQNASLKLEYRYTDYGKVTFGASYGDCAENHRCHDSGFRVDPDVHSVRLGVNVKFDVFGDRHAAPAYDSLK